MTAPHRGSWGKVDDFRVGMIGFLMFFPMANCQSLFVERLLQ